MIRRAHDVDISLLDMGYRSTLTMGFPFSTKPIAYICLFAALIQTLFFWLESIVPPRSKDGSRCREGLVSVKLPNSQRLNMSETTKSSHISSIEYVLVTLDTNLKSY